MNITTLLIALVAILFLFPTLFSDLLGGGSTS
jgi:hypothetical protein